MRNCHRANVAEPDLWELWPLQMGPVAAHILIIHTVSEKGGKPKKYQNSNGKIQRTNTKIQLIKTVS